MEKHCKNCQKTQPVEVLYSKRYREMLMTTLVVGCKVCKDKFLVIEKEGQQMKLFETPKIA